MALTLGNLVGQVRFRLYGLGSARDAQAELTAAIAADATTATVDDISGFARGPAEIGLEMVRIKTVDATTNTLTLRRGYKETVATAHDAATEITFNPIWPSSVIAQEINGVLSELYPDLYVVASYETTLPAGGAPVTLPVGTVGVIAVWLRASDDSRWLRVNHWDYRPDADRALEVGSGSSGQGVRVTYAARPVLFDLTAADPLSAEFEDTTGLPERVADLVALGVASRLAPHMHLARLTAAGAEARADVNARPADQFSIAARLLYSEFKARVQAEQFALVKEHPIRLHKAGR